ncbi:acyltransferase family protein [Brevundimonas staleyi]|uniref:Acyltransferase family protein n=1 Tax=Brevundimonas staleyi TaxID=74326 RepID=A0ABW0FPI5_9CAUL
MNILKAGGPARRPIALADPARSVFPDRLPALTSIRFWLALGVVLFHYQLNIVAEGEQGLALIERARLAVDFFFILSGFVLAHAYGSQVEDGSYSHRRFLIARLARIYPAHLAMLGLMLLIVLTALLSGQPFDIESYGPEGFLSALFLTHAWIPSLAPNEWNGPSWSLSAEWAAYLAFPIFAWAGLKVRRNPWIVTGVAATLFLGLDAFYRWRFGDLLTHAELNFGVLRIVPEFLLGVGLYRLGERLRWSRGMTVAMATGSIAALIGLMSVGADERLIVFSASLVILSLAMLARTQADQVFAHPWLLEAGEASYALYLVHLPLLILWKNGMALFTGIDSSYRMSFPEAGVLLLLTLACAFALHAFVERPARRWIRKRFLFSDAVR